MVDRLAGFDIESAVETQSVKEEFDTGLLGSEILDSEMDEDEDDLEDLE